MKKNIEYQTWVKPSEIIGILRNHLATGHVGKTMTVMMPIMIENIRMITHSLSILTNY